ncbi:hypothetical protein BDU57DRAFT_519346 [Ampelomyces quisqualis]|uniref:protein-histidine N-methyltransferase n=1 Tax=Ampelomyces quisqualis TaxID=50730 RepID=A0A6A5QFQ6_AMPQU|nr:hypothetical protein BDU57DRAFT_519346 [Ampelomyces quisqualis]
MSFSFRFSGDDIQEDPDDVDPQMQQEQGHQSSNDAGPPPLPAKSHDLDEMLSSLPSKISYSTLNLTSPLNNTTLLPRRSLFDVRLQLMAEDTLTTPSTTLLDASSDLTTNIYEGGYKTWECSLDLARYLLDRGPRKSLDDLVRVGHVIELGCGSALPSLVCFAYALREGVGMNVTVTDYNVDVLRLVTLPNFLLTWVSTLSVVQSAAVFGDDVENPFSGAEEEGDLYVTPKLIGAFRQHLDEAGIVLTFVSGSWSQVEDFLGLVPSAEDINTFVLASETIYSPESCRSFTLAMTALMRRVKMGKAVVAAKRVYFGVGGSVDGFRMECAEQGAIASEVEFEGLGGEGEGGVRRCLVEVQMY